ncbi:PdaC/SigV domain-containing protein [Sphingobium sufflavum]|uniref:PdaC/SigV domain-containing protein n=1 Tax=Sphingobium sufflavum TaxID=1129547 RepID=UPI001F18A6C6|nr:DUF4163 domain-containing protein [Sphingobium sufflavum]
MTSNRAAPAPNAALANDTAPIDKPQKLSAKVDGFEFEYQWPGEAAAIPALDSWLRGNGESLRKSNQSDAMAAKAEAKKDAFVFNGYSYQEDYTAAANTPRFLVLISDGYVYTGGAHGMPINTAILWDKASGKRLATSTLIDLPRFAAAARKRFCDALDKQREEKRGEPVRHDDPNDIVDFNSCVDLTKQLVVPISHGGRALDTVQVIIGPYEAGPYSEGRYVIDLPLDAGLLATVKPAYRDAFAPAD